MMVAYFNFFYILVQTVATQHSASSVLNSLCLDHRMHLKLNQAFSGLVDHKSCTSWGKILPPIGLGSSNNSRLLGCAESLAILLLQWTWSMVDTCLLVKCLES